MRRIATTVVLTLAVASLAVFGSGAEEGDASGSYLVRAVFDNGNFMVPGEEVRIAGASVGSVESVDVSNAEEIVSLDPEPHAEPGKAIIVLRIDDAAFQDFRQDASCIIRPQSLLGEKYIDCQATEPRAPGTEPPPPLETVAEGEPGAGQHLLPVERNGKSVDLDLVNNIMRRPYRERFSIILNDLGAGLAARGEELGEVIDRANPALRETDKVLAVLARQSDTLKQLASDSDTVLGPLARERRHISGFIANAGETAAASAERRAEIETGLNKLPPSLRKLRATMAELRGFAEQATPVFSDLGGAAPSIAGSTSAVGPLADAATPALRSLGKAAAQAGPDIKASDPVIKDLRDLADASAKPATNLSKLLRSLRSSGGFEDLLGFIFNLSGSVNGLDQYGHFIRTQLLVTNCTDYTIIPLTGCEANFIPGAQTSAARAELRSQTSGDALLGQATAPSGNISGDRAKPQSGALVPGGADAPADPGSLEGMFGDRFGLEGEPPPADASPDGAGIEGADRTGGRSLRGANALMQFLMEDQR